MFPAIAPVLSALVLAQANASEFSAASIKPSQLYRAGGEGSGQDRYDVIAKTAQPACKEQLMLMMQTLLADQFQLKLHRDTRVLPVYELAASRKATKLMPSASDQRASMTIVNGAFFFGHVTIEGTFDIGLSSAGAMRADPSSIARRNRLRLTY